jgi:hypothetical protein
MRYFPDGPIGCHPDGRAPVFLYLVRAWDPFEFRLFLQRHGALLRALAEWRIRLLVPPHLEGAEKPHEIACWNEFATPLKPDQLEELRWYFERRRALGEASPDSDEERFRRAHVMFSKPRYRALYKQWSELGDGLLELQGSPPWRGSRTPPDRWIAMFSTVRFSSHLVGSVWPERLTPRRSATKRWLACLYRRRLEGHVARLRQTPLAFWWQQASLAQQLARRRGV